MGKTLELPTAALGEEEEEPAAISGPSRVAPDDTGTAAPSTRVPSPSTLSRYSGGGGGSGAGGDGDDVAPNAGDNSLA